MRVREALLVCGLLLTGCAGEGAPPVVAASEMEERDASVSPTPRADPDEARLAELRATDQFDEFAEHERAARADGARLAWENFAPIVDGKRVEWTNKAELWDSIAPKIRDEALLLGQEYREPLWDTRNAVPNGISMAWNNTDTQGRGEYAEFGVTFISGRGPAERYWGALIRTRPDGTGRVIRMSAIGTFVEGDFAELAERHQALEVAAWRWVSGEDAK